jgi:hypothetical protein
MRADEILNEKAVESSWITNLTYNRPNRVITMRLSNGKSFSIPGTSRATFEQWTKSGSKGKYFHDKIKNTYRVNRIK